MVDPVHVDVVFGLVQRHVGQRCAEGLLVAADVRLRLDEGAHGRGGVARLHGRAVFVERASEPHGGPIALRGDDGFFGVAFVRDDADQASAGQRQQRYELATGDAAESAAG